MSETTRRVAVYSSQRDLSLHIEQPDETDLYGPAWHGAFHVWGWTSERPHAIVERKDGSLAMVDSSLVRFVLPFEAQP